MSRAHFFQVRLAISAAVLLFVYSAIRALWYPGAYYETAGASRQVWVLIAVVLVVGPVLSTLVYRPGKKGLATDLAVLAFVELAALGAAATLLFIRQPYFTVFAVDRFEAVSRQEVTNLAAARERFGDRPGHAPRLVFARLPEDPEHLQALIDETVLMGMPDIDRRPEFWWPYASGVGAVKAAGRPLPDLAAASADHAGVVAAWLRGRGRTAGEFLFLPLRGKAGDAALVIDAAIGYPVATIAVDPWVLAPEDREPPGDVEQAHQ